MDKKFIGSTVALVVGGVMIIGGLSHPSSMLMGGIFTVLGALAYRSAKKRKLGQVKNTPKRKMGELLTVGLMICLVLFQKNVGQLMYDDPVINLIIPVWAVIAYLVVKPK